MKKYNHPVLKSVAVAGLAMFAIAGCSNQVETTGNTIPSNVPANNNLPCCPQQGGNSGGYNVLDNPNVNTGGSSANVYTPTNNNNPGQDYYNPGSSVTTVDYNYPQGNGSGNQQLSNDRRPAVQVLASSSYDTANGMRQQMNGSGYSAIVVQIDGLYKVRVPYNSYNEAKANLNQIRTIAPDAFVAH